MFAIRINDYQTIFIAVGLAGILLFASPTVFLLIEPPEGQQFSEIYLLGPNQSFEGIPFNITAGVSYTVYLGFGNNIGQSSYYTCYVKIINETESVPNTRLGRPSEIPALYEYKFFITDGEKIQLPLTFQIKKLTFENLTCSLSGIRINGVDIPISKNSEWSADRKGYCYSLIAELWVFNPTSGISQFNNRFVSIPLNMTQ